MSALGTCIWCGHQLTYAEPGSPPGDCKTATLGDFYSRSYTWRDFSLIDMPLVFGKFCMDAPPHPLGQFSIHQLVSNIEQP
jgi:hypothetical protein